MNRVIENNKIEVEGIKTITEALKKVSPKKGKLALNFAWNKIGDEGAKCLAEIIPLEKIYKLNIENNGIGIAGINCLSEAILRMKDKRIHVLNIAGNKLGNEGAQAISKAIISINKLFIGKRK